MNGQQPGPGDRYGGQEPLPDRRIALVDLLDRLLGGGVVLTGDIVLSVADVDLVRISLRALIVSISGPELSPWRDGRRLGGDGP
ncbi:gas vesicle protein [Kitasatospora sp. NPDC005751]|uniref:gas vesicle protein n=1 Tax=unclassified Kitasatospora TaxID=2633591 RepID=UPI00340E545D